MLTTELGSAKGFAVGDKGRREQETEHQTANWEHLEKRPTSRELVKGNAIIIV